MLLYVFSPLIDDNGFGYEAKMVDLSYLQC